CDGDAQTGTLIYTVRANQMRDDIAAATGVPGQHGFAFDVPDHLKDGKRHSLHIYGMGRFGLVELAGSPQAIEIARTGRGNEPRADGATNVEGVVDAIDQNGVAIGWTLVPSFTTHPINIAVFADGDADSGTMLFTARSNVERPDLEQPWGTTHHGFESLIPDELMDDKPHSLTVYGVGPQGFTLLATSPRDFQLKSVRPIGSVDGL